MFCVTVVLMFYSGAAESLATLSGTSQYTGSISTCFVGVLKKNKSLPNLFTSVNRIWPIRSWMATWPWIPSSIPTRATGSWPTWEGWRSRSCRRWCCRASGSPRRPSLPHDLRMCPRQPELPPPPSSPRPTAALPPSPSRGGNLHLLHPRHPQF